MQKTFGIQRMHGINQKTPSVSETGPLYNVAHSYQGSIQNEDRDLVIVTESLPSGYTATQIDAYIDISDFDTYAWISNQGERYPEATIFFGVLDKTIPAAPTWNNVPQAISEQSRYLSGSGARISFAGIQPPNTSELNFRIRARPVQVGGAVYTIGSVRIETSSIFVVTLTPIKPTITSPKSGFIDLTAANTFSWSTPAAQDEANLVFLIDGIQVASRTVSSGAKDYVLPANSIANSSSSNLVWRVRYRSGADWSEFSEDATLSLALPAPVPKSPLGGFINVQAANEFTWAVQANQNRARLKFYQSGVLAKTIEHPGSALTYTLPANSFAPSTAPFAWAVAYSNDGTRWSPDSALIPLSTTQATPNQPILVRPVGIMIERDQPITYRWRHNAPDGTSQASAKLEISVNNGSSWTAYNLTTAQEHTVQANTYAIGTILWRVTTYNIHGVASPVSQIGEFTIYGRPATPIILSVTSNTAKPLIAWGSEGQSSYELEIMYENGNVVYSSGIVLSNETTHKTTAFIGDGPYIVRVRITNVYGFVSDWASAKMLIITEKPMPATIFAGQSNGFVRIVVNYEFDSGIIAGVQLLRKRRTPQRTTDMFDDMPQRLIAASSARNFVFDDYSAAPDVHYEYIARVYTFDEAFADSAPQTAVCRMHGIMLALADNPNEGIAIIRFNLGDDLGREQTVQYEGTPIMYEGRELPVFEFGKSVSSGWGITAFFKNTEDLDAFKRLVAAKKPLIYRDMYGRKMYGIINAPQYGHIKHGSGIGFTFTEIDYREGAIVLD